MKALGSCGRLVLPWESRQSCTHLLIRPFSYLDGGTNVPFQEAAVPFLEPDLVLKEMKALQTHFKTKRDYVVGRLREIGFKCHNIPDSTFYIWLDLTSIEPALPFNDGLNFFERLLKEKVIVVSDGTLECVPEVFTRLTF